MIVPLTPDECVAKVLRAYDGTRMQGFGHEFTLGFVARKLDITVDTITKALEVRRIDQEAGR
jgi:hypothetical protein